MSQINLSIFQNKKIALLGAGVETLALAKFLTHNNIKADLLEIDSKRASEHKKYVNVVFEGKKYLDGIGDYDLIVRSPGFPLKKIQDICQERKAKGAITSAIKLFLEISPAEIIGVTGTKGKGTTSNLIYDILKNAGKKVFLAGNIGLGPFDFINELDETSVVVLELSSFQLEDFSISPQISVILEISPDHLEPLSSSSPNYHVSIEEYVNAKTKIIAFQQPENWVVLNCDHEYYGWIKPYIKSKKIEISTKRELENGVFVHDENIIAKGFSNTEFSVEGRKLLGKHNLQNIAAATAVALIKNIDVKIIQQSVRNFTGLPHRLQLILQKDGIKYIDDSYATGPAASIAAISSFKEPTALILGGSSKGADFNELAKTVCDNNIVFVSLIGEEADAIAKALDAYNYEKYKNFKTNFISAVKTAEKTLHGQGILLLSPACASKDMFNNAAERGDLFKKIIEDKKLYGA